ncbi:MAG TPA: GTP cyclohydrolase II RibA [Burkholderiales bacterium]|nr:GTP cyclohydrolase II RibA [Burkholderiales bacterium]
MSAAQKQVAPALFGSQGHIGVSRGLAEFHAGRPILMRDERETLLALPVEGLDAQRLAEFTAFCAPAVPRLVITARRAFALGLDATGAMTLKISGQLKAEMILALVAGGEAERRVEAEPAGSAAHAAIELAKLSQGLPAVLAAAVAAADLIASERQIVTVEADAVARYREESIRSLTIASKASVPLKSGSRASFVVFRNETGESPVAIIIGKPDFNKPVPVRLHSACLTGDVFGSRRCDCGDQLQLSLNCLEERGGGIVLYLPQEGRGVGLANKMRTYQMQDEGLDTIDANTTLGFDEDERDYGVAARMLRMLDCNRIVLMTNNPAKLAGLQKSGIEIAGRMPVEAPINVDNHRYLTAKAVRAGHRLHDVLERGGLS